MSYRSLSPTLWNTISFKAKICHFSIVYRNAPYTMVPQRTVSSWKPENQMGTNIPGQNKARRMASNLHKYYPSVMHLGQETKPFICKVNTRCCQKCLTQPEKASQSCQQLVRLYSITLLDSWVHKESRLGFHLRTTFFNLVCLFVLHSVIRSIHRDSGSTLRTIRSYLEGREGE